ncbi:SDR family NAD(P)-dependent oxidoreductase [Pseudomonadota bacterium]|nr:SDR family NAD(P)-dependent oxidoreductase [Pseudomonadota bacterium]
MTQNDKVCLVIGAGRGIGGAVGKKFAKHGFHACLVRRSDGKQLKNLVDSIIADGYTSSGFLLNAIETNKIENLIDQIESDIGPIEAAFYNLGAQIGNKCLAETSYKTFERGWRLGTFGLFRLAQTLLPKMVERKKGTIIVTSSTAAVRGNEQQHSHAAAMGGRRMLCQTLNAEFGPKGIHIAHVIVDGAVEAPDTLGKMLGTEAFAKLKIERGGEKNGLLIPEHIANTYMHLYKQHPSTWTHEMDLRSAKDIPWWNTRKSDNW